MTVIYTASSQGVSPSLRLQSLHPPRVIRLLGASRRWRVIFVARGTDRTVSTPKRLLGKGEPKTQAVSETSMTSAPDDNPRSAI